MGWKGWVLGWTFGDSILRWVAWHLGWVAKNPDGVAGVGGWGGLGHPNPPPLPPLPPISSELLSTWSESLNPE